jgi:linoleoyl-CoA desaturase
MKTLQFIKQNKNENFTAVLRKNVNRYFQDKKISTKGNYKMILKSIAMISLYLVPFILMLTLPISGWFALILFAIMGVGMAGIGMNVMHDAIHGSFSKKNWLNKLFGSSIYLIGGNRFTWKVQHNILHHTYTNIEGFDEDIEPKGSIRMSKSSPVKKVHRFQHIYAFFLYSLMTISKQVQDFLHLRKYNKAGITEQQGASPKKEMLKMAFIKAGYISIFIGLPLLFSVFSGWMVLAGFLTMHLVAGMFLSVVFQMAQLVEEATQPLPNEKGMIENEWTIHELETTANFAPKSRWFAWLIGGLNFQIEHHLFPNICHIHYKSIAPIVEKTAKDFGLRYNENRTFFSAIGSHIRMLKALGKSV